MENSPESAGKAAQVRIAGPPDWTADELKCLQETSKIIGIPLSSLVLFAEHNHYETNLQPAATVATHSQDIKDVGWTGDELTTLQRAAQIISVPLSQLLSFAKTTAQCGSSSYHLENQDVQNNAVNVRPGAVHYGSEDQGQIQHDRPTLGSEVLMCDPLYTANAPSSVNGTLPYMLDGSYASGTNMEIPSGIFPAAPMNEAMQYGTSLLPSSNVTPIETYHDSSLVGFGYATPPVEPSNTFGLDINRGLELDYRTVNSGVGQNLQLPLYTHFSTPDLVMTSQNVAQYSASVPQMPLTQPFPMMSTEPGNVQDRWTSDLDEPKQFILPSRSSRRAAKAHGTQFQLNGLSRSAGISKAKPYAEGTKSGLTKKDVQGKLSLVSCIRCNTPYYRCEVVGGSLMCYQCQNQAYSWSTIACPHIKITDILLFRTTTDPVSRKPYTTLTLDCSLAHAVNSLLCIESSPTVTFGVTQDSTTVLQLSARRFDSSTIQEGKSAQIKALYAHPYMLVDLKGATLQIRKFILKNVTPYIKARVASEDRLSLNIFAAACHRVRQKLAHYELLIDVLCLWTAARTIEGGWRFVDPESLGLNSADGAPVPFAAAPFLDYQFTAIMVQNILLPLKESVLRRLDKLTYSKSSADWFTIFLTNFFLLHSYGLLIKQQQTFARRRNSPFRYSMMSLIKDIHVGARTLLAHFHYVCKGRQPFETDWTDPRSKDTLQKMAQLSHDEVNFMISLSAEVRGRVSQLQGLMNTDAYESDHWFTGQLFVPSWTPPQTIEEPQLL